MTLSRERWPTKLKEVPSALEVRLYCLNFDKIYLYTKDPHEEKYQLLTLLETYPFADTFG